MRDRILTLTRAVTRRVTWVDAAVLLFVGFVLHGLVGVASEWRAPLRPQVEIDLSLAALPGYTFFSLCRGFVAFGISFAFTLGYGYVAARVRGAERLMLPLLDILQSIPVLGFMPGLVLALVTLFPLSNVGLELAAILMIFTGQVWNMTFSFYHSLRAIPPELMEAARVYGFDRWRRFRVVELPASTVGLVWNGMMSMAGGWFFLTVTEAFRLGEHDFRLPGIGAYMSAAIDSGDHRAMLGAVVAMVVMIVVVDQLFWRPLVAWADRFKVEEIAATQGPKSWALDLLRHSQIARWLGSRSKDEASGPGPAGHSRSAPAASVRRRVDPVSGRGFRLVALAFLAALATACVWGSLRLVQLLATLDATSWGRVGIDAACTLARTTAAVAIGSLWTIPAGIYIGTHPRAARALQPVVQILASFPAPMLYPLALLVLSELHMGLGIGAVVLMILGTQYYILFNVIAGVQSIPHDLEEVAAAYRFTRRQRWTRLLLPGTFPQLVTGWVTAAGGAWNASIVSEYVLSKGQVRQTRGLGALISESASKGRFALLAASVLTMALVVVAINHTFWRRLYALAERRFALSR
jgi:NitT/TauT family transport system permease protein